MEFLHKLIPVILVGIWIWLTIKKSYKEDTQKQQQVTTTMDEVFPTIETDTDTATDEPQYDKKRSNISTQNSPAKIISKQHTAVHKKSTPTNTNSTHEVENRKGKITLDTKSEAKKAFIYSEIFNKKY